MRKNILKMSLIAMAFGAVTLFSSCLKNDHDNYTPPPQTGLAILHGAPGTGAMNVLLNDQEIGNGEAVNYTEGRTGTLDPKNYKIEFKSAASDSLVASVTDSLKQDKSYSVVLYGPDTAVKTMLFQNQFENTSSPGAFLRFLQLSPDLNDVTVMIDDGTLTSGRDYVDVINNPEKAKFELKSGAQYKFTAIDAGGDTIDQISKKLSTQAYYTLYLDGIDSTKTTVDSLKWKLRMIQTF